MFRGSPEVSSGRRLLCVLTAGTMGAKAHRLDGWSTPLQWRHGADGRVPVLTMYAMCIGRGPVYPSGPPLLGYSDETLSHKSANPASPRVFVPPAQSASCMRACRKLFLGGPVLLLPHRSRRHRFMCSPMQSPSAGCCLCSSPRPGGLPVSQAMPHYPEVGLSFPRTRDIVSF